MLRNRLLFATSIAAILAMLVTATLGSRAAVAAGPYIEGIDVSHWQGEPNWAAVAGDGVQFVIAKATQGREYRDPQYERNRLRARANSLPFSAYHYAVPDATPGDAVAEADHFVNTARLDRRNLLPVLDLEDDGGLSAQVLREWVATWLARVEERLGVKPMIYTSPSFWVEHMADTTWFADNGYRLWIAHWNVTTPTVPAANWGGRGWTLWQYAVKRGVDGISGKVDHDRYQGDSLAPIRIRTNR